MQADPRRKSAQQQTSRKEWCLLDQDRPTKKRGSADLLRHGKWRMDSGRENQRKSRQHLQQMAGIKPQHRRAKSFKDHKTQSVRLPRRTQSGGRGSFYGAVVQR